MPTLADLQRLSQQDFPNIDKEQLVDIRSIEIDPDLPIAERLLKFLEEVKNPYLFRVGKVPIRVMFSETGKPLDTMLKSHFLNARKAL
jgi:hypothetical protein